MAEDFAIEHYSVEERVYHSVKEGVGNFIYLYETMIKDLGVVVPFDDYKVNVVRALGVAPTLTVGPPSKGHLGPSRRDLVQEKPSRPDRLLPRSGRLSSSATAKWPNQTKPGPSVRRKGLLNSDLYPYPFYAPSSCSRSQIHGGARSLSGVSLNQGGVGQGLGSRRQPPNVCPLPTRDLYNPGPRRGELSSSVLGHPNSLLLTIISILSSRSCDYLSEASWNKEIPSMPLPHTYSGPYSRNNSNAP
ncbi:hypothetical protein CR513_29000, partial [Mucuna pruriens]